MSLARDCNKLTKKSSRSGNKRCCEPLEHITLVQTPLTVSVHVKNVSNMSGPTRKMMRKDLEKTKMKIKCVPSVRRKNNGRRLKELF